MSDQHYATPNADLTPDATNTSGLMAPLLLTKPWVRLCSVLGFVSTVFIVLAGIGLMAGGAATAGIPYGTGVGVAYMLMGLLYFMPSLFLFKYASAIALAQQSGSSTDIAVALGHQKSFWKFAGVVALVMIVLMFLGVGAAIVVPLMMG